MELQVAALGLQQNCSRLVGGHEKQQFQEQWLLRQWLTISYGTIHLSLQSFEFLASHDVVVMKSDLICNLIRSYVTTFSSCK